MTLVMHAPVLPVAFPDSHEVYMPLALGNFLTAPFAVVVFASVWRGRINEVAHDYLFWGDESPLAGRRP